MIDWNAIVTIAGLAILAWYRVNKKHKQDKARGVKEFLERNIVECIFAAVLVPDAFQAFIGWLMKLGGQE